MNRARILAATALLAVTALPACNGLHTPTAAEQGAKKMEKASAKARALASRIAFSPDAVSKTLPVDGGEARELAQTLLAPAEAAKELRTLASEVAGAGAIDAQRRDAKVLATRMRRDALMLDLMDLERIAWPCGRGRWQRRDGGGGFSEGDHASSPGVSSSRRSGTP